MTHYQKHDTFYVRKVEIIIDQSEEEKAAGLYYCRTTKPRTTTEIQGTPQEIGDMFGKWVTNTISAMEKNHASRIKMQISWE